MGKFVDIEIGEGLGEYVLGAPVGEVDSRFGYIIWDGDDYSRIIHACGGIEARDLAEADEKCYALAAEWLNERYGKGGWSC